MRKYKVGILTRPIDQGTSGSGHYLLEIVRHLLKQNKDFDITLIHYLKNDKDIYKGVNELIIPRNPFKASKIIKKQGFDLIHYSPLTILSPLWGVKAKKVCTIHGAEPDLVPEYYTLVQRLHSKYAMPFVARKMDHTFTVSETSKKYLTDTYKIDPSKYSITYNAVNQNFIVLEGNKFPANEKHNTGDKFIFHISKCSHRKNPEGIVKGFSLFSKDNPEYKLVLAGSGWDCEDVNYIVEDEGIKDKLVFTGFTLEEDVIELLNSASMFVFPSHAEGFGIPNVEAMSCACPVITSAVFAVPEVVEDAALVVEDPKDYKTIAKYMNDLAKNEELRKELIEKGLKRCKDFSWVKSADHILETYKKLIKE